MPRGLFRSLAMGPQAEYTYRLNPSRNAYVYTVRKHENFSRFYESHPLKGSHAFGEKITIDLPHRSDLLGRLQLRTKLPDLPDDYRFVNGVGYKIIKHIRIMAQDTEIFNCDGYIPFAENQLNTLPKDRIISDALNYGYRNESSTNHILENDCSTKKGTPNGIIKIDIPWCYGKRNEGFPYFPICAIKNRKVRIDIDLRPLNELIYNTKDPYINLSRNDIVGDLETCR